MNKAYVFSFDKYDAHGIDSEDAHMCKILISKAFPNVKFSSGIIDGVLGVRIERAPEDLHRHNAAADLEVYQTFANGVMATRHLWER